MKIIWWDNVKNISAIIKNKIPQIWETQENLHRIKNKQERRKVPQNQMYENQRFR